MSESDKAGQLDDGRERAESAREATSAKVSTSAKNAAVEEKQGLFGRLALFFRQIFAELKKVQRPTQSELWDIFLTVIIFVAIIMVFVGILDAVFSRLVFWIFG